MRIFIIGVGYVGLVTGTCFAEVGHQVTCLDIDPKKVDLLCHGKIPIYEPGLTEMVTRNYKAKRLSFTTSFEQLQGQDLVFIAVNTPTGTQGEADLTQVFNVAKTLGQLLTNETIVVTKSTVPPGTTFKVGEIIQHELNNRELSIPFHLCNNPEFLKEGTAIADFMKPDRIIVGAENKNVEEKMQDLFTPFMQAREKLITMDIVSSEMTKYAANAMLATRISFMNEMALIADRVVAKSCFDHFLSTVLVSSIKEISASHNTFDMVKIYFSKLFPFCNQENPISIGCCFFL